MNEPDPDVLAMFMGELNIEATGVVTNPGEEPAETPTSKE